MPRYEIRNSNFRHTVEADDAEQAMAKWAAEHPELASQTVLIKQEH